MAILFPTALITGRAVRLPRTCSQCDVLKLFFKDMRYRDNRPTPTTIQVVEMSPALVLV